MTRNRPRGRAAALFVAVLVGVIAPLSGCGKQGEGEPCSTTNGSNDCNSPYVCVKADTLRDNTIDRCCPAQGQPITDNRCVPSGPINGSGGAAGGGGTAGASQEGGDAQGGTSGGAGSGSGGSAGQDAGAHDATSG